MLGAAPKLFLQLQREQREPVNGRKSGSNITCNQAREALLMPFAKFVLPIFLLSLVEYMK